MACRIVANRDEHAEAISNSIDEDTLYLTERILAREFINISKRIDDLTRDFIIPSQIFLDVPEIIEYNRALVFKMNEEHHHFNWFLVVDRLLFDKDKYLVVRLKEYEYEDWIIEHVRACGERDDTP